MKKCLIIILTFNEEKHIYRCIESCKKIDADILVVDSFSSDKTIEIASSMGCHTLQNTFVGFSRQFNWALEQEIVSSYEWILRVDADEYFTPKLISSINSTLEKSSSNYDGYELRRTIVFLGKAIKYGGVGNVPVTRLFRRLKGYSEQRLMDEHIAINGRIGRLNGNLIDSNLNPLGWWIDKHNKYSSLESLEVLDLKFDFLSKSQSGGQRNIAFTPFLKRFIKVRFYSNLPPLLGPFFYFVFRYIFLLGFIDGYPGLFFHFLQAFWYRSLVDAKVYQYNQLYEKSNTSHSNLVKHTLGESLSKYIN